VVIKVGAVPHPMEEKHYIEWIEITTADGKTGKKFLTSQDKPEAEFHTRKEVISARIYCNIHGLWKS
jgi:superoxide reductase